MSSDGIGTSAFLYIGRRFLRSEKKTKLFSIHVVDLGHPIITPTWRYFHRISISNQGKQKKQQNEEINKNR